MLRVLFLTGDKVDGLSPATRMRVHYYLKLLPEYEIEPVVSPSWISVYFYQYPVIQKLITQFPPIRYPVKALVLPIMILGRLIDICRSLHYNVVVMQRDLIPIGIPLIEKLLIKVNPNVIFDFDDAIYMNYQRPTNWLSKGLWNRDKIGTLVKASKAITAGNHSLQKWALNWNSCVHIIPTCIDISNYKPHNYDLPVSESIILGWIGSDGNLPCLYDLYPLFDDLAVKYPHVQLKIVCGIMPRRPEKMPLTYQKWSLESEADLISKFDIGLMPLSNSEWARGKCGGKILQYFASALPVIASPVGVNQSIIENGQNGFLANNDDEWHDSLKKLIDSPKLRKSFGISARKKIEDNFTTERWVQKLAEILKKTAK